MRPGFFISEGKFSTLTVVNAAVHSVRQILLIV